MIHLESTRIAAIEGIETLMNTDKRFVMVFADSVKVFRAVEFVKKYPDRCFDVGIAEQNSVAVAAGLASAGLIPFVATYAGFLTLRACEQIRTFVAYPHLPVIFLGANGGIAGGEREGVTHQFIEDLGIARMMPGMTVVSPADAFETRQAVLQGPKQEGPVYIRIGSGRDPRFYEEPYPFQLNKVSIVEERGNDAVIFATGGAILHRAREAVQRLRAEGVETALVNVHTLKPLDTDTIVSYLKKTRGAVTIEDHTVIGGLGSAVAELAAQQFPVPIVRLGLQDTFAESGEAEPLLDAYGMGVEDICRAVKQVLLLKKL